MSRLFFACDILNCPFGARVCILTTVVQPPSSDPASKAQAPKGPWTTTFIPALCVTVGLVVALVVVGILFHFQRSEFALTALVCLMGYILGIPIGMAASPYKEEGSHFKTIGSLVASFLSGFAASKIAGLPLKETFFNSALQSGRSMLFISFFVLSVVQTFMFRRYYDAARAHDEYKPDAIAAGKNVVHEAAPNRQQ
jgi:hypothetical protein